MRWGRCSVGSARAPGVGLLVVVVMLLLVVMSASVAEAHETDNFTKPPERSFTDWGWLWTRIVHRNLASAVAHVNERIRLAESGARPTEDAAALREPEAVQRAVRRAFPPLPTLIDDIDRMFVTERARRKFPGRLPSYQPLEHIYSHSSFPLDPRQIIKHWRSANMKIAGVYQGSDKLGHFLTKGHMYYHRYRSNLRAGMAREEAIDTVVALGVGQHPWLSEKRLLGYWTSGVLSHGDLAADYLGLKFYINLTEPVRIAGRDRPPMLELVDGYWKLADHVRRDTDFFTVYISDHWDEALNPNLMLPWMRLPVRQQVERGCGPLLERHADRFGNRRPQWWFERRKRELSTYFGRDYGHQGRYDQMVSIPNACFPNPEPLRDGERDALGRTALHRAVIHGDVRQTRELLAAGADVDAPVRSREDYSSSWGDRPLHYAARDGRAKLVRLLLVHGADVNAANDRGVTPTHRAAQVGGEALALLLADGADLAARDEKGRTPLHWAATYPRFEVVAALIDAGADVAARDHAGRTPMHHAAAWNQCVVIEMLEEAGGDVEGRADFEVAPLHVAARQGHERAVRALAELGADLDAREALGRTPLHEAAAHMHSEAARALLEAGATVAAQDAFGFTALHEAARRNNDHLLGVLIDAGAAPNAPDARGQTPLHIAAQRNHRASLEALIARGGDDRRPDRAGRTPRKLLENAPPNLVDHFARLGSLHEGR